MAKPIITMRGRMKADGACPLYLEVRVAGVRIREILPVDVRPEDWDTERRVVRGRTTAAKETNMILQDALGRAADIIRLYHLRGLPLTATAFGQEFHQRLSREDFLAYWEEEMARLYARRTFGAEVLKAETRTLEKLRTFAGGPLPFAEISRKFLEKFDAWHARDLSQRGHQGDRERDKALRQIRKYLTQARQDGKEFEDPFENLRWPRYTRQAVWLEDAELRRIIRLFQDLPWLQAQMRRRAEAREMRPFDVARYSSEKSALRMREVIRAYLFQCFTGVRDSDLRALTWAHVSDGLLTFTPKKTQDTSGARVFFPLTDVHLRLALPSPGPLVQVASNQKRNKQLKVLAELAGIEKNLTTHVARHTFGSLMAARGVSLVSLQDLMGVTSVRTVMIYAHSSLDQQARELRAAQAGWL